MKREVLQQALEALTDGVKAAQAIRAEMEKPDAQPAPEPVDALGIPASCGKPLCGPGTHHPLCHLVQPAQEPHFEEQPDGTVIPVDPSEVAQPVLCVSTKDLERLLKRPEGDKSIKAFLPPAAESELALYTAPLQPLQPSQATEADDLLRALGLNPDAYRTDGGAINHLKVKAALKYPQEYLVQPAQEPLFWYRPRSDGLYEGPIHNAQIKRVRKENGGWVPLYARLAATQPECDSQPEPHSRFAAIRTKITEAMHEAAVKVLFRASGLDGTPQRMLDAMIATQPPQPTPARQWVEMTDEQLRDVLRTCPNDTVENLRVRWLYAKDFARAIEAALREKNGGAQ